MFYTHLFTIERTLYIAELYRKIRHIVLTVKVTPCNIAVKNTEHTAWSVLPLSSIYIKNCYVTRMTYFDHQSDTVFSRKPTVNPPLSSQTLSFCMLPTVAPKAAVLMLTVRCPVSKGVGEKAQANTSAHPPGIITLQEEDR